MKKAIVIGATGMVGTQLIDLLLHTRQYSEVVSLVRKPTGITHPKLSEYRIDFDKPEKWKELIKGDVLFSTLGTTLARAGSKDAQYKVDFTYQYEIARIAAKNGVQRYVLVSSAGANARSGAFYMRMKGQLEDAVKTLPFQVVSIIRPGQLAGERTEKRMGETIGLKVMKFLNKIGMFKRYRPIHARQVALAMINAANKAQSGSYTLDQVFSLAE